MRWIGELNTLKPRKLMGGDETDLLKNSKKIKSDLLKMR